MLRRRAEMIELGLDPRQLGLQRRTLINQTPLEDRQCRRGGVRFERTARRARSVRQPFRQLRKSAVQRLDRRIDVHRLLRGDEGGDRPREISSEQLYCKDKATTE